MKKIVFGLMATILSITILPLQSFAGTTNEPSSLVATKPAESSESAEANMLVLRLNEIKEMDMSKMAASEKKEMRKEVRSIKRELREVGGVVYVSAGTILLIVILLIVLL